MPIKSLIDVKRNMRYLVACANEFVPVTFDHEMFEIKDESTLSYVKRVIESGKIRID